MGRFAAVEEALRVSFSQTSSYFLFRANIFLQVNKLLVRSCFETEAWVERIAANPDGERRVKLDNEAGNTSQHGKLKFFTEAERKNPVLDTQEFAGASSPSAAPPPRPTSAAGAQLSWRSLRLFRSPYLLQTAPWPGDFLHNRTTSTWRLFARPLHPARLRCSLRSPSSSRAAATKAG